MRLFDDLLQDLRHALRSWARDPGWLLAAVLSVGLGVGAATTVIGGVDRLLRRPPPGLEHVVALVAQRAGTEVPITAADWQALADAHSLDLAAYRAIGVNAGDAMAERLKAAAVSPAFFRVTLAEPLLGRLPGGGSADSPPSVVVSEAFWRARLGADPAALGRGLNVDGEVLTIAAVLSGDFVFPATDIALWLPLDATDPAGEDTPLRLIGRLRAGTHAAAATAELDVRLHGAAGASTAPARTLRLRPVQDLYVTDTLRTAARIAVVTAVFVLLIACANVANLLLARGVGRQRELALRRSLGAGPGRLARQLLAESAVVAALGGVLGVVVAAWGGSGMMALWAGLGDTRPFPAAGVIDGLTLAVALAATAAATLLFGIGPALHAARAAPAGVLGGGGTAASTPRAGRAQRTLVVVQIALALALLSSAALLTQSFVRIQRAELGFRTADVLAFRVSGPRLADPGAVLPLVERLRALPGVTAAGAAESLPLDGAGRRTRYRLAGAHDDADWNAPLRVVTPGYLEALEIPVLRGRALHAADAAGDAPAVVVNLAFAARHGPDLAEPGRALLIDGRAFEIVGVVGDTREWGPHVEGPPMIYVSAAQFPDAVATAFVVRADGAAGEVAGAIRGTVTALDGNAAVHDLALVRTRLRQNTARSELMMRVMAIFAAVALLLAMAGVHATLAHVTLRRVPELAVRRALGATRSGIVRLVLRQGLGLVLIGVAVGTLLASGAARVLARFLAGTGPADAFALALAALAITAAALVACLGPAARAGRVTPLQALNDGTGTSRRDN